MTCTSNKSGPIYFECPDFGFGPASTTIELISRLTREFECHVISSGSALTMVRTTFPELVTYDIDTFNATTWQNVRAQLPPPRIVISNTNLPFAAWAIDVGYRVGVTDTLYWMWDHFPDSLRKSLFYVAQYYFGASKTADQPTTSNLNVIYVKPIIDQSRWKIDRPPIQHGSAVIAFGGMKLPLDPELPTKYVQWILDSVLPFMFESTRVSEVSVVGGLSNLQEIVPAIWRDDSRVRVRGLLNPEAYRDALLSVEYQLLTPGLTSMYEVQAANLIPFFLPGFSMSQLLQGFHLRNHVNYEHVAEWPGTSQIYSDLKGCAEENGVKIVSEMIRRTISGEPESDQFLIDGLRNYFKPNNSTNLVATFPALLADSEALEPIDEIIRHPLLEACYKLSGNSYDAHCGE